MQVQVLLPAYLASTGVTAIQSLGFLHFDSEKALSWPISLPGHGNLTVNMTAIADDANSTDLLDMITSSKLPGTFTISKQAGDTCDGRVDFDKFTNAATGDLCLGSERSYSDVVKVFHSSNNTGLIVTPSEDGICGCFCSCSIACMALLLLAPLCCKPTPG